MKRKNLLFICLHALLCIAGTQLYAQKFTDRPEYKMANSHWVMREPGRIFDMRTSPPTETPLPNYKGEGGTAISDSATGDLLFYSDGKDIYNRNHQVMPNGDNVAPNPTPSSMQEVAIVPVIGVKNQYYVFVVVADNNGLYYSVVDMTLNNGLGDVVASRKGKLLSEGPLQEGMQAIPGNHCDVWLLVHPSRDTNFLAYHITAEGVDSVPVRSSPGSAINNPSHSFEMGTMAVSPQRDKIAISSFSFMELISTGFGDTSKVGVMIAKFDPETGIVSEGVKVEHYIASGSQCFSPDGSKLYITGVLLEPSTMRLNFGNPMNKALFQFDVTTHTQTAIVNSITMLSLSLRDMMVGMRRRNDTIILTDFSYIPSPNLAGTACGYTGTNNYFGSMRSSNNATQWGIDAIFPLSPELVSNTIDTLVCSNSPASFSAPSGYQTYLWSDGSTDSTFTATASGTYWVDYRDDCYWGVDTFHLQWEEIAQPLISVNDNYLSTDESYDTYQWLLNGIAIAGATESRHQVRENGLYTVAVTLGDCSDTSNSYQVNNSDLSNITSSESLVSIYPNPAHQQLSVIAEQPLHQATIKVVSVLGNVIQEYHNVNGRKFDIDITSYAAGIYFVEIAEAASSVKIKVVKK